MRITSRSLLSFLTLGVSCGVALGKTCTLKASGGDDSAQFLAAVNKCDTVVIPKKTTLSIGTRLNMTGIQDKHISLQGTIKFTPDIPYWSGNAFYFAYQTQVTFWLLGGRNILLDGGGTVDGSGQVWYDAFAKNSSLLRPVSLTVYQATDVVVEKITMINGPEWFIFVNEGKNVRFNQIDLSAVSTSNVSAKNTDGWDIYRSDSIVIEHSRINNGDDCVSFKPNATNILVNDLHCNGSHGISVGSLGQYPGEYDLIANITSTNVRISNAQNGARIKAWAGPNVGYGLVKNITFSHFVEANVDNPLVIDQCYMTNATLCSQYPSNTYIEDVTFINLSGTSSGKQKTVVASLKCSPDNRCGTVSVSNLDLAPPTGNATYVCQNVNVTGNAASLFGNCTVT